MGLYARWERACAPGAHTSVLLLVAAAQPGHGKATGTQILNREGDGHLFAFHSNTYILDTSLLATQILLLLVLTQHLIHTPRPVSLKVQRDVSEAKALEMADDFLAE